MITIALIGSVSFCQKARALADLDSSYHLKCYEYKEPADAPQLMKLIGHCDVLMFSGSLPYEFSKQQVEQLQIPVVCLRQDVQALAITLLKVVQLGYTLTRISLDYRHEEEWQSLCNDLHYPPTTHTLCLQSAQPSQPVLAFHRRALESGQVDFAITSIHAVYDQLREEGYPATHIVDTDNDILHTLAKAKEQAVLAKAEAAQVAVGLIQEQHCLPEELANFAQLMEATLNKKEHGIVVYSTVGKIKSVISHPMFKKWHSTLDSRVRIAFGSGHSTEAAYNNALVASSFTQSKQFYFMDARQTLHGPYPTIEKQSTLSVKHPQLVELSQEVHLSPQNMSRIFAYAALQNNEPFTAAQLAKFLQVTRRTAERMLKKLHDANYASIIGEQSIYQKGRPSALYRLKLPTLIQ
ncbi:HTH domain-containing protein [Bacillus ndiopicus]|uniref:HTH domain-containing protein n=1 Tax=Bacillus ndiopicus TaxID=1347368 RepID=UPI0005A74DC4|nr:HTH domain-containing protein [Bacillus ndiopicus]